MQRPSARFSGGTPEQTNAAGGPNQHARDGYPTRDSAQQELRFALIGPAYSERTLLVFNGIGASLETVGAFADHFHRTRILTFDVPGVGELPAPRLPYRMSWIARQAARLLDHLGIAAVDVFGVSWGGAPAQQFARDFPARALSLTLAATSAGMVMVPANPMILAKLATPRRYTDPGYLREIGPKIYGGQLRHDRKPLDAHMDAMMTGTPRGYSMQLLAVAGWTSWLWLPRLKLPVLVMMGTDDPIVPVVNGRMLVHRLPDARLVLVECGHLFILTHPEETAATIEDFLHDRVRHGFHPARKRDPGSARNAAGILVSQQTLERQQQQQGSQRHHQQTRPVDPPAQEAQPALRRLEGRMDGGRPRIAHGAAMDGSPGHVDEARKDQERAEQVEGEHRILPRAVLRTRMNVRGSRRFPPRLRASHTPSAERLGPRINASIPTVLLPMRVHWHMGCACVVHGLCI